MAIVAQIDSPSSFHKNSLFFAPNFEYTRHVNPIKDIFVEICRKSNALILSGNEPGKQSVNASQSMFDVSITTIN